MATTETDGAAGLGVDPNDPRQLKAGRELVIQYLNEAYATESGIVTTLQAHIAMTPKGTYREALERHLTETRQQAGGIQRRLSQLGVRGNLITATLGLAETLVNQALAFAKGPFDAVRGASGEEKLLKNAKDESAVEAYEIATYDALEVVANAVGDGKTARLAALHRGQEERFLEDLKRAVPALAEAMVLARAGGKPSYDLAQTGAAEFVRGVAQQASETARTTAQAAQAVAETTARSAQDVAQSTAEATQDVAQSTAEATQDVAQTTAEATQDVAQTTAEATQEAVDTTARSAQDVAQTTAKATQEVAQTTVEATQQVAGSADQAAPPEAAPSATELPIEGYDALTAGQIVTRLSELAQDELAQVIAYERANRARRTVLDRAQALQGPEPLEGYDALDEAALLGRLPALDQTTLTRVRQYEGRHRRRVAVLEAAQRELNDR